MMAVTNMIPKGYHMMPSGKIMKDSEHKKRGKKNEVQNKRSKAKKNGNRNA